MIPNNKAMKAIVASSLVGTALGQVDALTKAKCLDAPCPFGAGMNYAQCVKAIRAVSVEETFCLYDTHAKAVWADGFQEDDALPCGSGKTFKAVQERVF